ncbi:hypothetical protein LEP1GSC073_2141 [Leptospira noguchii str. Cascata]|nr:hypothetical protein LEP1GSC072_0909 [Leptospira noguchii str. Bonito]EMS87433.1 hypothetical protein LEP1GSC073_2141 [Leptospira noguchii str. Cascata]
MIKLMVLNFIEIIKVNRKYRFTKSLSQNLKEFYAIIL